MEFFNKKEEVIDLKLTQFGRHMLSNGKLQPTYYSFHDDNILYNVEKTGISEAQNDSEARIVETPTMHHQISISSLEKEFNNSYEKLFSKDPYDPGNPENYSWELTGPGEVTKVFAGAADYYLEDIQRTAEKNYFLPNLLGTSDVNSEYSPSWSVNFLNGTLSGSSETLNLPEKTGGNNLQHIPQLESALKIQIENIDMSGGELDLEEFEAGFLSSNVSITSADDELYFLLKVIENNGVFQKENFDIELFEIQEEKQDDTTTIETLRQLKFSSAPDPMTELDFIDEVIPDEDTSHVEYYLDILVDDEISNEILCKFDPVNEKQGVYADKRTKLCQDVINQQKKKVFDIYTDESDDPGDIC